MGSPNNILDNQLDSVKSVSLGKYQDKVYRKLSNKFHTKCFNLSATLE